ncbi:MAG: hypothetical protein ACYSUK_09490 [Planctomycetota bacterium]|jgi:hypothetical protein
MKHTIPIFRIIFGIIALLLFCATILFFLGAKISYDDFYELRKGEPIRLDVDLSKTGNYSTTFDNVAFHGIYLEVVMEEESDSYEELLKYINGIKGSYSVVDPNGKIWIEQDFSEFDFSHQKLFSEPPRIVLYLGRKMGVGYMPEYQNLTFNLNIDQPAPALAGIEHKLIGRNFLCGLEKFVMYLCIIFGSITLGICFLIVLIIIIVTKKCRKKSGLMQS